MLSPKMQFLALQVWHGWLSGGFLVAWLTADEDTYAMHQFSGYAVLAALAFRLLVGLLAGPGSLWRLPRPQWSNPLIRRGRSPLYAWLAAALLAGLVLSALSGALADGLTWLEEPHEAASELVLWIIAGHAAFIFHQRGGRRLLTTLSGRLKAAFPMLQEKAR